MQRFLDTLWPRAEERRLLGRFYVSRGVGELFNVIWPFQFAYLFLVMDRVEWAVVPLIAESAVALLADIPTGAFADRFGRRLAVITGDVLSGVGLLGVPLAVQQEGTAQLAAVSACFGLTGFGAALVSGAAQAWVVDNLAADGRRDLVATYFARLRSFVALGAIGAAVLALLILATVDISARLLHGLWGAAGIGCILTAFIEATIAEHRLDPAVRQGSEPRPGLVSTISMAVRSFRRSRSLFFFFIVLVITSFPESAADDAFDMSLITRGMDARGLAPLAILDNVIGMIAPLIGLVLARLMGAPRVLVLFLVIPALAAGVLLATPPLWTVIVLYILLDFFDNVWDPVAEAHLQGLISSDTRATVTSVVSYGGGVTELLGIGLLSLLLGEYSEAFGELVPDLVTAFSGEFPGVHGAPLIFGLPLPDFAILVFVFTPLLAVPFIFLSAGNSRSSGTDPGEGAQRDGTAGTD